MKYRVILSVGYNEAWFEFDNADGACNFGALALAHMVSSEDTKKKTYINMQIVDKSLEESEG